MKKMILFATCVLLYTFVNAQTYSSEAPYLQTKKIPPFNILQTDSSWFSVDSLSKSAPTVIVYFSPDCGHCQETAKELASAMSRLSKTTFVFVTYLPPLEDIAAFMKDYGLDKYANVHYGKDPQYLVPSYFRVEYTPFIALYTPKGQLTKAWPSHFTVPELEKLIQEM